MADGEPVPGSLYVYAPSKSVPIVFIIAFAISAVGHLWQCHRYKCWKLVRLHPLCAVLFTVGYAFREYGAYHDSAATPYIISQVLIYVCPPLLELANYNVLGRVLHYVPHLSPLRPDIAVPLFSTCLSLVNVLNALGAVPSLNPSKGMSRQDLGSRLTLAAIGVQLGVIATLLVIAGLFHSRCRRAGVCTKAVSTPLVTLYVSAALISTRSIYLLVKHTANTTVNLDDPESLKHLSPLLRYEWYFYVFESTVMLLNSLLWNIWNPGRYLPQDYRVRLADDDRTEGEGEHTDDRPLLAKLANFPTFGILLRRKQKDSYQSAREPVHLPLADVQD